MAGEALVPTSQVALWESAQPPAKTGNGIGGPGLVQPGILWGAGCHMGTASHQVSTIDLLASGLNPMETWREAQSLSPGQLEWVFFWGGGLGEEASSVTTGLLVTGEA